MKLYTNDGIHTFQLSDKEAEKWKKRYGKSFKEVKVPIPVALANSKKIETAAVEPDAEIPEMPETEQGA